MLQEIRKRDGRIEPFNREKIKNAIWQAALALDGTNEALSEELTDEVVSIANTRFAGETPEIEDIQDIVEKVLIENGHARTAKAYILYREKRRGTREINAMIGATIEMFGDYLKDKDWG
ncbi:MAG: ATP cone domain-containing protein, partial [Clostridiales bacterium]|nr:ATP cone domain-containing protein [Clostridiales bacterium]